MTGYRQSSFDPFAHEQPGKPLRPFNWVQRAGVLFEVAAIAAFLAFIAGKLGWIAETPGGTVPFLLLSVVGMALINSRREPSTLVGSEQLQRNRRTLLITAAVVAVILAVTAVLDLMGIFQ